MEETLQHWGILGMHWGRRKDDSSGNSNHTKSKVKPSEDHIAVSALRNKKLIEMSNAEIRTLATRIQLEQQYKSLNPTKIARGKQHVKSTMDNVKFTGEVIGSVAAAAVIGKKIFDFSRNAGATYKAANAAVRVLKTAKFAYKVL
jgi:hypothetical protein